MNERQNILIRPRRLTIRSLCGKSTNNRHYIYSFYYCHIFPKIWHGIIIRPLMVLKICYLSYLNSWLNLLDTSRKRQMVTRIKVERNKGICPEFGRNVLGGCRDNHDELPLVDPAMNLPLCQLQELTCLNLFLLRLEVVIRLIETACTSLLLPNLGPLLYKMFEGISDINVILESIICE